MAQTAPPAINALPTPPSTLSPGDFDSRADAFLGALPARATEMNASASATYGNAVYAYDNAVIAQNSAADATSQAAAAAASVNAPAWNISTTYALGAAVYSTVTGRIYRCTVGGTVGGPDPSAGGNWSTVKDALAVSIASTSTVSAYANTHYVLIGPSCTVTLPASPVSGDEIWITIANGMGTNVIACNGKTIQTLAEDMTINYATITVKLRYVNADWKIL